MSMSSADSAQPPDAGTVEPRSRRYLTVLVLLAFAGWALAAYDTNLLVLAIPDIAESLHLSATKVGLLGFVVYIAQFFIVLAVGRAMDSRGRKVLWQWVLVGTAVFTGLTFFVQDFWQLAIIRCLAGGFAASEQAVAIALINEEAPRRHRGLLYSIVQSGFSAGVLLASAVYLLAHPLGWRVVFALGVLPLVAVIIGRRYLRESDRWLQVNDIRRAKRAGDHERAARLAAEHRVDLESVDQLSIWSIFRTPGYIRRQLAGLSITWIAYGMSMIATNVYITYWLTTYAGWTAGATGLLLLISGAIGIGVYIGSGWIGEQIGRREVLGIAAVLTPLLALLFLFLHGQTWYVAVAYCLLFQTTNGLWSGVGYSYWGESFPTRVRGTAVGWLAGMLSLGQIIGTGVWTLLIGTAGHVWTWLIIAVLCSCGQLLVWLLRRIPPGAELEQIAT